MKTYSNKGLDGMSINDLKKAANGFAKCAHSHPALTVEVNGETLKIYGGSASGPVHHDCDIYVALDGNAYEHKEFYPWNSGNKIFISFYVTDMSVPKDIAEYKKMVKWLGKQIMMGRKVHIGCLGGHGRTGTLLAALVMELTGNKDAITYVRKHYCKKAVESSSQVQFLKQHFGINPVPGYKEFAPVNSSKYSSVSTTTSGSTMVTYSQDDLLDNQYEEYKRGGSYAAPKVQPIKVTPIRSQGTIWGDLGID